MISLNIPSMVYLFIISIIFYIIIMKIFKYNKKNKITYFFVVVLLFYIFYKVIPTKLFGNNRVTEGMSLSDSLMSGGESNDSGEGNIDYTKGWDTPDNFRENYCSKDGVFIDSNFFDDKTKETGNPNGGLVYGLKEELYDKTNKELNKKFIDAIIDQAKNNNKINTESFTKANGCFTNLTADSGKKGSMTQMCNPKCNFNFTGSNSSNS
jgi:hypothetical protein